MQKGTLITFALLLFAGFLVAQTPKIEKWANGQLKSSGNLKFDVPVSANASKADLQKAYSQMVKVGKWQYWFENGQLRAEENYTEGSRTGIQKSWYASGKAESLVDLQAKTATYWFENGQKQSSGVVTGDGLPTGTWIAWHANGLKNTEGAYDQSGKKTGTWKFWDDKGQLIGQQNYVNGVVH
jgi:antitoxin component YwqK of YwqJK toxin-antitoxin module